MAIHGMFIDFLLLSMDPGETLIYLDEKIRKLKLNYAWDFSIRLPEFQSAEELCLKKKVPPQKSQKGCDCRLWVTCCQMT